MALVRAAEDLTGEPLGITEAGLAAVRLETLAKAEKTEDL